MTSTNKTRRQNREGTPPSTFVAGGVWFAASYWMLNFLVRPLYKHGEYVYGWPRVNISIVAMLLVGLYFCFLLYAVAVNKSVLVRKGLLVPTYLLGITVVIQLIYLPSLLNDISTIEVLETISVTIFGYSGFYIMGIYISNWLDKKNTAPIIIGGWVFFTVFEFLTIFTNKSGMFKIDLGGLGFYLMVADSYAIYALLTLSVLKTFWTRVPLYLLTITLLVGITSRTGLFVFAAIAGFYLLVIYRLRVVGFVSAAVMLVILIGWVPNLDIYERLGIDYRVVRIFYEGQNDLSIQYRDSFLTSGLRQISDNWLLGDFMGDVRNAQGYSGTYIHNILSYWRQFGIAVFFLLIYVLTKGILATHKYALRTSMLEDRRFLFMLLYAGYAILSLVFSRSHMVPYVWMCVSSLSIWKVNKRMTYPNRGRSVDMMVNHEYSKSSTSK